MSIDEIKQRQNKESLLKYQYAARVQYNKGERNLQLAWMLSIASFITELLPFDSIFFMAIAFSLDILVALLLFLLNLNIKRAASIRNRFDDIVLGFKEKKVDDGIGELVYKICQKNEKACLIQISNTGRDNPPGVKEWYEFGADSEKNPVFECQKQNCWWETKLYKKKIVACIVSAVVLVIGCFISFNFTGIIKTILASAGMIIFIVDRMVANIQYFKCSSGIDAILDVVQNSPSRKQIQKLQEYIENRRSIPVVGVNSIYQKVAKRLSEMYQATK